MTNSKNTNNKPRETVNRSSITGQFVTDRYAKEHPKTTEKEHYKRGK